MQVNIPAESGDMGVLANHVPSIEQLKPGLVEVIEESGGSKQYFCMFNPSALVRDMAEMISRYGETAVDVARAENILTNA